MDTIQQEINMHKLKLLNLVNNLINTQLIDEEIFINNEIKTENECLKSLLNIKQNNPVNQFNQNNNININPFMLQQNLFMNPPMLNANPINPNNVKINIQFFHGSGVRTFIFFKPDTKISEMINEYRRKTNDFEENYFIFNGKRLDPLSTSTIEEMGILNFQIIYIQRIGGLKA